MCSGISFCLPLDEFKVLPLRATGVWPKLHHAVELANWERFADYNPMVPTLATIGGVGNPIGIGATNGGASLALWFFGVCKRMVAIPVNIGFAGVNG